MSQVVLQGKTAQFDHSFHLIGFKLLSFDSKVRRTVYSEPDTKESVFL